MRREIYLRHSNPYLNLVGGVVSVDDTRIEKIYSDVNQAELIGYYWSGKYPKTIKGINLITLYHCDIQGNTLPVIVISNKTETLSCTISANNLIKRCGRMRIH